MVRSEGNRSLKIPVTPPGIAPGTVRLVAQRLNPYATPGPISIRININLRTNLVVKENVALENRRFSDRGFCRR